MNLVRMANGVSLRLKYAAFVKPRDFRIRVSPYEIRLNINGCPIGEVVISKFAGSDVKEACYYRRATHTTLIPSRLRGSIPWSTDSPSAPTP